MPPSSFSARRGCDSERQPLVTARRNSSGEKVMIAVRLDNLFGKSVSHSSCKVIKNDVCVQKYLYRFHILDILSSFSRSVSDGRVIAPLRLLTFSSNVSGSVTTGRQRESSISFEIRSVTYAFMLFRLFFCSDIHLLYILCGYITFYCQMQTVRFVGKL